MGKDTCIIKKYILKKIKLNQNKKYICKFKDLCRRKEKKECEFRK